LRGVSPFVLAGLRFALASFPAVLVLPRPRVPARLHLGFALATFLGQFSLLFWAIKLGMPSGLASLVLQSQVFFTIALAGVMIGEQPNRRQILGMSTAAAGLVDRTAGRRLPSAPRVPTHPRRCGRLGRRKHGQPRAVPPRLSERLAFVVWAGLLPIIPFFALAYVFEGPEKRRRQLSLPRTHLLGRRGLLAYAATLVGYGLWNRLLTQYAAAQVARFTLLVPVVGLFSGALFFGKKLTPDQLAGSALVVAGLAMPLLAARATTPPGPAPRA